MQKRQHTVPRCYLENFADKDGFVWVLDTKDNIFKIRPENILVENNFYTVKLKNGDKSLIVEDTLSNIEAAYASIFRDKISQDKSLTDEERAKVAVFFAALMLRTRPYRENMRRAFTTLKVSMQEWKKQFETIPKEKRRASVMSSDGESITMDEVDAYLGNFDEEHSVNVLTNLPEIAQIIFNMKWAVLVSSGDKYVTSDDPLVLLRPEALNKYGPKVIGSQPGLMYKDVELTLALSKDRLLLAGWILEQDSYLPVDNDMVRQMNHRTIIRSSERIITSSEDQAKAIRDRYTETAHKNKMPTDKV
ncbi:DUF4238 domain-containing protein [Patescibacteria group bacterium]|nr:DUF4238 domain-containing protein [Patescibacteria group bacterium]MDE1946730.1 DUF4238 domain-containing protein [Patescibacteria group bacterium]MDE2010967.1 DUF4238 domain-containing protein [Patescibacteria group bacterium]MDE2232810.1 DUF4238 domain-containing protein [Patescibacteria group bacterium]